MCTLGYTCTHLDTDTQACIRGHRGLNWNLMHKHVLMPMHNCFSQTPLSGYRPVCICWAFLHPSISCSQSSTALTHTRTTYAWKHYKYAHRGISAPCTYAHNVTHADTHTHPDTHPCRHAHTQLPFEPLIHQPSPAGNRSQILHPAEVSHEM